MNNWNIVEILKQFSPKQKLFVLIFMVLIIGSTTVITTYLTSNSKDLEASVVRLKEDNKILKEDIEKLKKREEELSLMVMTILQKATNLRNNLREESNNSQERVYLSVQSSQNSQNSNSDSLIPQTRRPSSVYATPRSDNREVIEGLNDIIESCDATDTIN